MRSTTQRLGSTSKPVRRRSGDDLDDEVEEGGLLHELGAIMGAIGEQVLDRGPALANRIEDHLGTGATLVLRSHLPRGVTVRAGIPGSLETGPSVPRC